MKIHTPTILLMVVISFTQGKIFYPNSSEEFQSAINTASVGDSIELLPLDYRGDFVLPNKSGSVTIRGTSSLDLKQSTKIFGSGRAFSISGDKWELGFLNIESGDIGIEIKGSHNILNSLSIHGVKKGIVINGDDNLVDSVTILDGTHGILVNGSRNIIQSVTCSDMREESIIVESGSNSTRINSVSVYKSDGDKKVSVLLKEGSSQGVLNSLTLDGIVQVRGDNYKITSCSFVYALNLHGQNNSMERSTVRILHSQNYIGDSNFIKVISNSPVDIVSDPEFFWSRFVWVPWVFWVLKWVGVILAFWVLYLLFKLCYY